MTELDTEQRIRMLEQRMSLLEQRLNDTVRGRDTRPRSAGKIEDKQFIAALNMLIAAHDDGHMVCTSTSGRRTTFIPLEKLNQILQQTTGIVRQKGFKRLYERLTKAEPSYHTVTVRIYDRAMSKHRGDKLHQSYYKGRAFDLEDVRRHLEELGLLNPQNMSRNLDCTLGRELDNIVRQAAIVKGERETFLVPNGDVEVEVLSTERVLGEILHPSTTAQLIDSEIEQLRKTRSFQVGGKVVKVAETDEERKKRLALEAMKPRRKNDPQPTTETSMKQAAAETKKSVIDELVEDTFKPDTSIIDMLENGRLGHLKKEWDTIKEWMLQFIDKHELYVEFYEEFIENAEPENVALLYSPATLEEIVTQGMALVRAKRELDNIVSIDSDWMDEDDRRQLEADIAIKTKQMSRMNDDSGRTLMDDWQMLNDFMAGQADDVAPRGVSYADSDKII